MKRNLVVFLVFLLLVSLTIAYVKDYLYNSNRPANESIMEMNKSSLIKNIKAVKDEELITLQELTDFKWDTVYQFGPFADDNVCDQIVGKHLGIQYSYNGENPQNSILFTLNGKAVCYIGNEVEDINISLFSMGSYKEHSVSYKYSDLKSLYVSDVNNIRMPDKYEMYKLKMKNTNFQYSKGTAYYLYGGFGSELNVVKRDIEFPCGHLINFEHNITDSDYFRITPQDYNLTNINYNNANVQTLCTQNTEIEFYLDNDETVVELEFYGDNELTNIIIDQNTICVKSCNESNGKKLFQKKIHIAGLGFHKLQFENDIYLYELWQHNDIPNDSGHT